jgi:hypothetical protein
LFVQLKLSSQCLIKLEIAKKSLVFTSGLLTSLTKLEVKGFWKSEMVLNNIFQYRKTQPIHRIGKTWFFEMLSTMTCKFFFDLTKIHTALVPSGLQQ